MRSLYDSGSKLSTHKTSQNDFTISRSRWKLCCPTCDDRNVYVMLQRKSMCSFLVEAENQRLFIEFIWTRGEEPAARGPNATQVNIWYGPQQNFRYPS